jgi:cytosine/adenosine deaminase-related metal-dependent hydrolase
MYLSSRGAMFDWLKSQRDMSDCGGVSPIAHLARYGVLSANFLAVHVNYLAPGDVELLARGGASVVHCPGSHAYFRHRGFPFGELDRAGINICLGTDSLATMVHSSGEPLALNLFSEMRRMANAFPMLTPQRILEMATVNAAKALGRTHELGRIVPGALADLIALPRGNSNDVYEAILSHRGDLLASMVQGQWAIRPAA